MVGEWDFVSYPSIVVTIITTYLFTSLYPRITAIYSAEQAEKEQALEKVVSYLVPAAKIVTLVCFIIILLISAMTSVQYYKLLNLKHKMEEKNFEVAQYERYLEYKTKEKKLNSIPRPARQ